MAAVTAVVVNFFSSSLAAEAVRSLLEQDPRPEVWVVDNSVEDEEAASLESLLPSGCNLLINRTNMGFGGACNQVFEMDDAPYLFLLNPDARLLPGALGILLMCMEQDPEIGAVGPFSYWDPDLQFIMPPNIPPIPSRERLLPRHIPWSWTVYLDALIWRRRIISYWLSNASLMTQWDLCGGHVLLRRRALEDVGGLFDPRFFMYFEDTDLFWRLRRGGWRLAVARDAKVVHRYDQSGTKAHRAEKVRMMQESYARFVEKHFPPPPWWGYLIRAIGSIERPRAVRFRDLGPHRFPPSLHVPSHLHGGWLLEVSPSPTMVPFIGHFGSGPIMDWHPGVVESFVSGIYYLRFSDPGSFWASRDVMRIEITHED